MAKNTGLGLPQNRGSFQFKGIVTGCNKDSFYKTQKTKTNKDMRTINFGLQVAKDSILYVTFNGMVADKVYYSGKAHKDDKKNETVEVAWKDRYTFKRENFKMIGINCGLEKTIDEKGKEVNDKKILHAFDAAEYVAEHLKDGMSVFVRGNIEYGHYEQNGNITRTTKYVPTQISLCQEVDFDAVDEKGRGYEVISNFEQPLVFQNIEKGADGKFVLTASIVNFASIEETEFIIDNEKEETVKLANSIKKNLKPYHMIKVWGNIATVRNTDEVEVESNDGWGSSNPMQRVTSPYKTVKMITGAEPSSIDKETYSESKFEEAMETMKKAEKTEKSFESQGDDWGSSKKSSDSDDEDTPW